MKKIGINASPGIAMGKVFLYEKKALIVNHTTITDINGEFLLFRDAVQTCKTQIEALYNKAVSEMGEADAEIFQAHLMVLEDPEFEKSVNDEISQGHCAAWAVESAVNTFAEMFLALEDDYFKERAADIRDVGNRLLRCLLGIEDQDLSSLPEETVLIAHDLAPSDTAQLDKVHLAAFATDIGGRTSHTAIMARTLEIPAVLGLKDITQNVKKGDTIIIDGNKGEVIIAPDASTIEAYRERRKKDIEHNALLKTLKEQPAETTDGHRVILAGNIGSPADIDGVLDNGGEGVGLYRTEFLYMNSDVMPDEEIQFEAYKKVVEAFGDRGVIIRTLDIGGDKTIPYLPMDPEMNPFLGLRAIRLCLKYPEMFKTQLRAILRASSFGNAMIMFPMIACIEEVRQAKAIIEACKAELTAEGKAFDHDIKIGIMVEIPAAAVCADIFAAEVDFFSIGTNDLCQYTLAVDRMNPNVAYLYDPLHPAILKLVKNVIDAAHHYPGKFTGMCGEMAGDPEAALILLGLGLDEFSMSASAISHVKNMIRNTTLAKAQQIAQQALTLDNADAVRALIKSEIKNTDA